MTNRPTNYIVRWTFNNRQYSESYEFMTMAIAKQLALEDIGIDSIVSLRGDSKSQKSQKEVSNA